MSTTDFFTRCWKNARLSLSALLCALVLALPGQVRAQPAGPALTEFSLERTDAGLYLSVSLRLELAAAVVDALEKGIPVYFVAEADLMRDRWYWYDRKISSAVRYMRLAYQPLTRRWRLNQASEPLNPSNPGVGLTQHFDTLGEAVAVLARLTAWKIAEPGQIDPKERHNVDFRFRLDTNQLPRLIQLGGSGLADWNLSLVHNQRLHLGSAK